MGILILCISSNEGSFQKLLIEITYSMTKSFSMLAEVCFFVFSECIQSAYTPGFLGRGFWFVPSKKTAAISPSVRASIHASDLPNSTANFQSHGGMA